MSENDRDPIAHYQRKCAIAGADPLDAQQQDPAFAGFASAARNETRLRSIEALGVGACSAIRIRGRWQHVLPLTSGWSAGELDEIARGGR